MKSMEERKDDCFQYITLLEIDVVTKLLSRKYCKTVASKLYTQDTFSIQV
jgi:hypothetical protein